jgi:hypothetical protein
MVLITASILYPLLGDKVLRNPLEYFSDQDVLFTFYPIEHYFFYFFKEHGSVPQYNFLNGIGYTFASDGQYGQFYLIKYLFLKFSNSFKTYGIFYYIFHELLAALFSFILADNLYEQKVSKWLFVLLYINTSIFVIWIGFPHLLPFLAFLPLVVLGFVLLYKSQRLFHASLLIGFGLGMVGQGGHLSNLYYLGLLTLIYAVPFIAANDISIKSKMIFFVLFSTTFLLVSAPSLYGFLEAHNYQRHYSNISQISVMNFVLNLFIFHGNYPNNNDWQNGYLFYGPIAFFVLIFFKNIISGRYAGDSNERFWKSTFLVIFVLMLLVAHSPLHSLVTNHLPLFSSLSNLNRVSFVFAVLIPLIIIRGLEDFEWDDTKFLFHFLIFFIVFLLAIDYYASKYLEGLLWLLGIFFIGAFVISSNTKSFKYKSFLTNLIANRAIIVMAVILFFSLSFRWPYAKFISGYSAFMYTSEIIFCGLCLILLRNENRLRIAYISLAIVFSLIGKIVLINNYYYPKNGYDKIVESKDRAELISAIESTNRNKTYKFALAFWPNDMIINPSTNLLFQASFIDSYKSFFKESFLDVMNEAHENDYKSVVGGIEIIHRVSSKKLDFNWYKKLGVNAYILHKDNKTELPEHLALLQSTTHFNIYVDKSPPCLFLASDLNCNGSLGMLNELVSEVRFKNDGPEIRFKKNVDIINSSFVIPAMQYDKNIRLLATDSNGHTIRFNPIKGPRGLIGFDVNMRAIKNMKFYFSDRIMNVCVFLSFIFTLIITAILLQDFFRRAR